MLDVSNWLTVAAILALAVAPSGSSAAADPPLVAFLGDSLTEGYGLSPGEAYPALVAGRLEKRGLQIRSLNAGVSGDTTGDARRRLGPVLARRPAIVVVALGVNDFALGRSLDAVESDLRAIVTASSDAGAHVLLAGMRPLSGGRADEEEAFTALYARLAAAYDLPLVDLLADVVGVRDLNMADRVHPNAAGQERLAARIEPELAALVEALASGR